MAYSYISVYINPSECPPSGKVTTKQQENSCFAMLSIRICFCVSWILKSMNGSICGAKSVRNFLKTESSGLLALLAENAMNNQLVSYPAFSWWELSRLRDHITVVIYCVTQWSNKWAFVSKVLNFSNKRIFSRDTLFCFIEIIDYVCNCTTSYTFFK